MHGTAGSAGTSHKIAIVAVAHPILEIAWHLLAQGTMYHGIGADYIDRCDKEQAARRYARLLEKLGYRVTLEPAPLAAAHALDIFFAAVDSFSQLQKPIQKTLTPE